MDCAALDTDRPRHHGIFWPIVALSLALIAFGGIGSIVAIPAEWAPRGSGARQPVSADVNQDGYINGADFDDFTAAYTAGSFGPIPTPDEAGRLRIDWRHASRVVFRVQNPASVSGVYIERTDGPAFIGQAQTVPGHPAERFIEIDGAALAAEYGADAAGLLIVTVELDTTDPSVPVMPRIQWSR